MVFHSAGAKMVAVVRGTVAKMVLKNTYNSHGNFSHKERDVSFSISEKFGSRSMFRSEQPDTFPC